MKKIPWVNLRIRLFLLLLISVIPGLVVTLYELVEERQRENVEAQDFAFRLANIISVQQQDLVIAANQLLFALSEVPDIKNDGIRGHSSFLTHMLANLPPYSDIGITDTKGNVIASAVRTAEPVNIADRHFFRAALETGAFAVGEYQISRSTGTPSVNFAYPIVDDKGTQRGVLFAELSLEKFSDLESRIGTQLPEGWILRELDRNGLLLAQYPDGLGNIGHPALESSTILSEFSHGHGTLRLVDSTGKSHLYAHSEIQTRVFPTGISVLLDIPGEYAISAVNRIFARNLVLLAVVGLLILFVGAVANELYLVRGLNAVRNAAVQLAGGNFQLKLGQVRGLTEVKELGRTFNEMSDMIERREESLRESEGRYRALFTFSPDALYVHVNGRVTLANPALCRMLGADDPSQLVGKSVFDIVHPDYYGEVRERWNVVFRGQPVPLLEEKFIRLDGTAVDVEVSAVAIEWQASQGVQVIARDISERKKAEADLKASIDQLHSLAQRLERIREEERKTISHEVHDELGQVLTALKMDLMSLAEAGPAQRAEFEAKIESSLGITDRAIGKVQDIASRLRPEMLDYLGLLAAIEWQTDKFQERTGIQCSLDLPDREPPIDSERATALFRILQETLTNVVRHAAAKKVRVHLAETTDQITMSIIDDGIGISQEKIRDPRSLGLLGMRERLLPFEGICTIQKGSAGGTEVLVRIPKRSALDHHPP